MSAAQAVVLVGPMKLCQLSWLNFPKAGGNRGQRSPRTNRDHRARSPRTVRDHPGRDRQRPRSPQTIYYAGMHYGWAIMKKIDILIVIGHACLNDSPEKTTDTTTDNLAISLL